MEHTKQPCRFFTTMILAVGFLLVFSVGGYSAELRKLSLAYSTVGPSGTGLWMAKEIGAFEKYGINADLICISSGPVVVQALIGGDLHGGLAATNAVISAVMAGAPLVSVMSLVNRPYFRLWVQPEITRIEEHPPSLPISPHWLPPTRREGHRRSAPERLPGRKK